MRAQWLGAILLGLLVQVGHPVELGPAWVTVVESGRVLAFERLEQARKKWPALESPPAMHAHLDEKYSFYVLPGEGPRDWAARLVEHEGRTLLACLMEPPIAKGRELAFLSEGGHPMGGASWAEPPLAAGDNSARRGESRGEPEGRFAVLEHGRVARVLPGTFYVHGAGRGGLISRPNLALSAQRQKAFFDLDGRLACYDLERGQVDWTADTRLGWNNGLQGAYYRGNALYVRVEGGLARLQPDTGQVIWRTDQVKNWVDAVWLGDDLRLYVISFDAP
ncbi:MAG: hypothetical protein AB1758_31735 [Candidatus Eremiobacterota bacterium]